MFNFSSLGLIFTVAEDLISYGPAVYQAIKDTIAAVAKTTDTKGRLSALLAGLKTVITELETVVSSL